MMPEIIFTHYPSIPEVLEWLRKRNENKAGIVLGTEITAVQDEFSLPRKIAGEQVILHIREVTGVGECQSN
jgi:hypothetical protein